MLIRKSEKRNCICRTTGTTLVTPHYVHVIILYNPTICLRTHIVTECILLLTFLIVDTTLHNPIARPTMLNYFYFCFYNSEFIPSALHRLLIFSPLNKNTTSFPVCVVCMCETVRRVTYCGVEYDHCCFLVYINIIVIYLVYNVKKKISNFVRTLGQLLVNAHPKDRLWTILFVRKKNCYIY